MAVAGSLLACNLIAGPGCGNEVILHDRVQRPFRTDFVCEFTASSVVLTARSASARAILLVQSSLLRACLAFIASSLHVLSGFGILQGR